MNTAELKSKAKEQLKGRWGVAIGTVLVANIFLSGNSSSISNVKGHEEIVFTFFVIATIIGLALFLLAGTVSAGLKRFLLDMATGSKEPKFATLFSQFNIYGKTLGLYILTNLCILVGTLLFIVPGIIVSLMFSQVFFILAEDPSKSITQCIKESVDMMKGHKWELFWLELTFIGWGLLTLITCGIAGLWVSPYKQLTEANFYLYLKNN